MQRWTASYSFQWTPIITFSTRRLRLLEWFEKNADPLAFFEDSSKVGIAVHSRDLKLTVTRSGLAVENGDCRNADSELAFDAIAGILNVMEPSNIALLHSAQALSQELAGVDYSAAGEAFAGRMVGVPEGEYKAKDASALADIETNGWDLQPEWGVVTSAELVQRIENPKLSRGGALRPSTKLASTVANSMPDVSVFVDVLTHPSAPFLVSDADGIINSMKNVDMVTELLAIHLAEGMEGDAK